MKIDVNQIPDEVEREFNRFEGVLPVKERMARALGKWPGARWFQNIRGDDNSSDRIILPLAKEGE